MSRVLVTGGGGFIGRPLVATLGAAGHEVHVVGRGDLPPGAHAHRADLLDPDAAARLVADVRADTLVHLAWCTDPAGYREHADNLAWTRATLQLLNRFAAAGGRRAVLTGSVMEYDPGAECCVEGETPLAPSTLYGSCKAALSGLTAALAPRLGLSCAWARVFWVYGPGEQPGRLVSSLAAGLVAGEPVALGPGSERRDYMHVADVAGALAALAQSDVRGAVNVGSGHAVAIARIAEELGHVLGRPELVALGARPAAPGLAPVVRADVRRLRDEVGFTPAFDLRHGLRDAARWWQRAAEAQLAGSAT